VPSNWFHLVLSWLPINLFLFLVTATFCNRAFFKYMFWFKYFKFRHLGPCTCSSKEGAFQLQNGLKVHVLQFVKICAILYQAFSSTKLLNYQHNTQILEWKTVFWKLGQDALKAVCVTIQFFFEMRDEVRFFILFIISEKY